jgi:chromosome segregation and condensation protein ScpB
LAATTLLERGIVEEAGRSQFGTVLCRTTELFLKLFGLDELGELPASGALIPLRSSCRSRTTDSCAPGSSGLNRWGS